MLKACLLSIATVAAIGVSGQSNLVKMEPVSFANVNITDSFWKPKLNLIAKATLPACIYQTETATARIRNFEKVARNKGEQHEGIFYDDSDVFKALEAMSYSLKTNPDPALEKKCDEWIEKIAAAQQPDGYLNTWYTLKGLDQRWTDMSMHEDYNGGHMIEAAVAYFETTGKRKFLDICIRWADHFDSQFGPGKKHWVTGHQELELALVKLFRVTKNEKYLKLSHWLLEERGHRLAKGYTWTDWKDTAYAQDLVPVRDQKEITGHAVRAMYMYTGAADVAAYTGDHGYMNAMKTVWEDVVHRNMYITGGIGSAGSNEGFSVDYDLPNERAYCETCASVGMVFWNQRMNALTGDSKYIDILERSLYNGALDGLSLSGDRFFYGNPLASSGQHARREWFGTACCPANIARLVASLGDYIYATRENELWVNLFVGSEATVKLGGKDVKIKMETNYPWDGRSLLTLVSVTKNQQMALHVRIPGWLRNQLVPGELYQSINPDTASLQLLVNGKPVAYKSQNGYAVVEGRWKQGDKIEWTLPMKVQVVRARPELKQDTNRVALQRGPLVYCVEGADNNGKAWNLIFPEGTPVSTAAYKVLNEPVISLEANVPAVQVSAAGVATSTTKIRAIPYYAWANRGKNEMQVWLPTRIDNIKINY